MDARLVVSSYRSIDLISWQESATLVLTPKFQRNRVWSKAVQSYFVDSVLQGYPTPPIHFRSVVDRAGVVQQEVIDGQQRLSTIFDFFRNRFAISRVDSEWAGMKFDDLPQEARDRLAQYQWYAYQYEHLDDRDVLEIFARLNTYSTPLNKQELRNGKFFGQFKNTAYELAADYLEVWRMAGVFTEARIARMADAELTSELLVMLMFGPQDKKSALDSVYDALDDDWGTFPSPKFILKFGADQPNFLSRDEAVHRFRGVMDDVRDIGLERLRRYRFQSVPLFYSLFEVLAHRRYGIPGWEEISPFSPLEAALPRFQEGVAVLGSAISEFKKKPLDGEPEIQEMIRAVSSQTDNIAPRRARARIIWRLFGAGAP